MNAKYKNSVFKNKKEKCIDISLKESKKTNLLKNI
jgi:hypothetical protein